MATGRTLSKWIRFCCDDAAGTPREVPINSLSPVGFSYDETDVTAWQDAVKGYLSAHPDAPIDIGGPFDTSVSVAIATSGNAPALSGSHTILNPIAGGNTPLALAVMFGIRGYWTTGDPVFGVVSASVSTGYLCTKYQVSGESYTARFVPFPGTTPAWGTTTIV